MLHNKFDVLNICMSLLKALVQFSIALIVQDEWAAIDDGGPSKSGR